MTKVIYLPSILSYMESVDGQLNPSEDEYLISPREVVPVSFLLPGSSRNRNGLEQIIHHVCAAHASHSGGGG